MGKLYALTSDEVTALEKENQELVRSLAGECMVVLENDGTLPLKKGGKNSCIIRKRCKTHS
ncbi:hypothetical protein WAA20_04785 [Butyrivibrio fibrisolvens]|uniref:hypothetical protein n=1 Tax=Butyrivibrio fibrisolvens TaxID=831 RepID=UPI0030D5D684